MKQSLNRAHPNPARNGSSSQSAKAPIPPASPAARINELKEFFAQPEIAALNQRFENAVDQADAVLGLIDCLFLKVESWTSGSEPAAEQLSDFYNSFWNLFKSTDLRGQLDAAFNDWMNLRRQAAQWIEQRDRELVSPST